MKIPIVLLFTFHQEYCITRPGNVNILCRVLVMGHSGNSRVFNFAIFLNLQKLDACEIFMFYSMLLSWTEMREIVFWYLLTLALCDAAITYIWILFRCTWVVQFPFGSSTSACSIREPVVMSGMFLLHMLTRDYSYIYICIVYSMLYMYRCAAAGRAVYWCSPEEPQWQRPAGLPGNESSAFHY